MKQPISDNRKPGPAVQRAIDFLRNGLQTGVWKHGDNLPCINMLAKVAGVSRVPMAKAIAALKAQEELSGIPRGPVRAGRDLGNRIAAESGSDSGWRLKRRALEEDIHSGVFARSDALPSIKVLQSRYDACFRTMQKVLRSMADDKVVYLHGRSYAIVRPSTGAFSHRIIFITRTLREVPRSALNPAEYRVIDSLERECIRRRLQLEIVEVDLLDDYGADRAVRMTSDTVLGYVVDVWWFESEELRRSYVELLTRLARFGKPVALLDEVGGFALATQFTRNPFFQAFRFSGTSGGSLMARHLLSLGHRSVAYISPSHTGLWSVERFEGIEAQFRAVGAADTLHLCTTNVAYDLSHTVLCVSGLDDTLIRRLLIAGRTTKEAEKEYDAFVRFREKGPATKFEKSDVDAIIRDLAILVDLGRRNPGREAFDRICSAALTAANMRMNAMILTPLFERARKIAAITAWICANDLAALAALAYLRKHAISVPADMSVAGFDNLSIAALENRLTSYDFNTAEFIYRSLEFIARPPKPRGAYRHFPIEVEGTVVVRGTTGKSPSHHAAFVV